MTEMRILINYNVFDLSRKISLSVASNFNDVT
jgi:hypothetical protein